MDTATWVQILEKASCISNSTNTLAKRKNPTILPPDIGKIVGQTRLLNVGMGTGQREENPTLLK